MNARGSVLAAMIMAMALLSILLTGYQMIQRQSLNSQHIVARALSSELSDEIKAALNFSKVCACNLAPYTLDTSQSPSAPLKIAQIRSTCNQSAVSNLVAEMGKVSGGITISKLQIEDIRATAQAQIFTGNLVVVQRVAENQFDLKPIEIPITLTVDLASGSPGSRPISSCTTPAPVTGGAGRPGIAACPAGYLMVGKKGAVGSFCISAASQTAASQRMAMAMCASKQYDIGFPVLCSYGMLNLACHLAAADLPGIGTQREWLTGAYINFYPPSWGSTLAGTGCETLSYDDMNANLAYHCCIQ